MNWSRVAVSVAVLATAFLTAGNAESESSTTRPNYHLMVFETRNCFYCEHFRYAVAPVYQQSSYADRAPLQYIDVQQTDFSRLALHAPITVAPTTVLTRDGQEVARIAGVTTPDAFLLLVGHMFEQP